MANKNAENTRTIQKTLCGFAAIRTRHILPGGVVVQGIAALVKGDVPGKFDRQILFRHRNGAAGVAVKDWDGTAPVALPGNAPVAQPVNGFAFSKAGFLKSVCDDAFCFGNGQAV